MSEGSGLKPECGEIREKAHLLPLRVYYEDTDVGGIVYYANYLKFMERGRSDMLRVAGIDQTALLAGDDEQEGLMFVVRQCNVDYLRPARFGEEILVVTRLCDMTAATFTMAQEVWRGDDLLVTATVKAAVLSKEGRPRRLPSKIRHILAAIVTLGEVSEGDGSRDKS